MALKSRNKVKADFNMSSMTDIVFLLLIFFMLTSTLVSQNVIEALSYSESEDEQNEDHIEVHIDEKEEYSIKIDGNEVSVEDKKYLEGMLKNKFSEIEDPGITLYIDKTVPVDHAMKIMEIARKNKYKFEFRILPPKE